MSTTDTDEVQKAGRREWIGLAVITLPCLLYAMDLTVLNLAVPQLSADLKPSATQLLWIVDIYGFLVAGSLITMGTLGDRIGRRRLLMIGAAAFALASILAAFSRSAEMLIAARALLGVAGATLAPSTLSLIRNMFHDPAERTVAISVWGTSFSVGGLVGPVLGGVLLEYFWWGSVFLLAVPVMALLLVVAPKLLPEFRDPRAGRLDILSAAMSLAAVLAVIYGLKQVAEDGFGPIPALFVVAGLVIGVLFFNRQRHLADPLIDLALFSAPAFSAAVATNILGVFVVFGTFLFTAQYFQLVLGLSPLEAGLWMLPSAVAVTIGSMAAPLVVRRFRPPHVMATGFILLAIGLAILTQVERGGLAVIVAGSIVLSTGLGPVFILAVDLIVGAAPPERAGAAAGISETGAEFGGVLGIAVLGSIGVAIYRAAMAGAIPEGVPAAAAKAARDTLGGAFAASADLPAGLAEPLLAAAREAFTRSFVAIVILGAVIALLAALLAAVVFRNRPRQGAAAAEPATETGGR